MSINVFDQQVQAARECLDDLSRRTTLSTSQGMNFIECQSILTEAISQLTLSLDRLQIAGTDLQQQNQRLETELLHFQQLFEFAPDAYLISDCDGIIQQANRSAATLLNTPQNLLMGQNLLDFLPEIEYKTLQLWSVLLRGNGQLHPQNRVQVETPLITPHAEESFTVAIQISAANDSRDRLIRCHWALRDMSAIQPQEIAVEPKPKIQAIAPSTSSVQPLNTERVETTAQENQTCLRLLNAISTGRLMGLSVEQIIDCTLNQLHQIFPTLRVTYCTIDEGNQLRVMQAIAPPEMPAIAGFLADLTVAPAYLKALRIGEPIVVEDVTAHPALQPLSNALLAGGRRAILDLPLKHSAGLLGILTLDSGAPCRWSESQIIIMREIADFLTLTIQEVRAQKERALAQAAQRESDRRFRALFDQTFQLIVLLEPDGTVLEMNSAALNFAGVQRADVVNRRLWEIQSGAFSPEVQNPLCEAIARSRSGEFVRYEVELPAEEGFAIFDISIKPVKAEMDRVVLLIFEARDILELKQTQQERDRFFKYSMDLMSIADFQGQLKLVNPAWEKTLGLTWEDLEGKNFSDCIYPDDREATYGAFQRLAAGQPLFGFENRHRCKDGSYRWLLWNAVSFLEEGIIYGFARDITERKQAEAALQESEARFRNLIETSSDWVWEVDENFIYTYASPKVGDILGYAADEIVGKTPFDLMPEEEVRRLEELCHPIIPLQQSFKCIEKTNLHKNGDRVILESSGVPFFDAEGRFRGYRGIDRDISDRVWAEKSVRKSEEKYRKLMETAKDAIFIADTETGILVDANPQAEELIGKPLEEIIGQHHTQLHPSSKHEEYGQLFIQHTKNGSSLPAELLALHKDGREIPIDITASVFEMDGKKFVQGIFRDISYRVEAEKEKNRAIASLEESERRFRAVFNQTFQFCGMLAPDGTLLEANQTALDFADIQLPDVVNCPFWDAPWWRISSDTQETLKTAIARSRSGEFIRYEVEVIGAGGKIATIDFSLKPVKNERGEVVLLIAEGRDISEIKQTRSALQLSKHRYELAVRAGKVGVWDWNLNTNEIYLDPILKAILGYENDEITNHLDDWGSFVHPEDRVAVMAAANAHLEGRTPYFEVEHRMFHKDGSIRWILARGTVSRDASGKAYRMTGTDTDISDRKQAEIALQKLNEELEIRVQKRTRQLERSREIIRQREQEIRALVENSPDIIARIDREFRYLYINPAITRVTGLSPESFIGKTNSELEMPQECIAIWDPSLRQVFETGKETVVEFDFPSLDGVRSFQTRLTGERNQDGAIETILAISRDITARKQAEAALQASEHLYRLLAENATDMISQHNSTGVYIYVSPACRHLLGYEPDELIGRSAFEFFHPEDIESIQHSLSKTLESTLPRTIMYRIRHKNGHYIWFETTGRRFPEIEIGVEQGVIAVSRDVSDRVKVEDALRKSEEGFRRIFEDAPIGMAIADAETYKITKANRAFCQMLGYTPEQLAQFTFVNFTHPEDVDADLDLINRLFAGHISSYQLEKRYINKNGEIIWGNLTGTLLRDTNGKSLYGLAMIEDVTERRQVEERLRLLESVVVNAHDAISIATAETKDNPSPKIVYVNEAFTRITGYSHTEVIGTLPRIFTREKSDRQTSIKTALKNLQPVSEELIQYRKDSVGFWIERNLIPIADNRGNLTHIAAIERDITERKQAEEKLREAEIQYRTLVERIPVVTYTVSLHENQHHSFISPQIEQLLDISPEEWMTGKTPMWHRYLHPEDRSYIIQQIERSISERLPFKEEYRIISPNRKIVWVRDEAVVICDESDRPLMVQGVLSNITDRKQLELALTENEERFRTSVENMLDCFAIYSAIRNEAGQIVDFLTQYANAAACADRGIPKEEFIGQRFCEIFRDRRQIGLFDRYCKMIQTGEPLIEEALVYEYQFEQKCIRGAYDIRAVKLGDGFAVTWRDISDRLKAETALQDSESRYRAIVEDQTELICRFLSDGTLTFLNESYCRYFNKRPEELIGKIFTPLIPNEDQHIPQLHISTLCAARPVVTYEHRVILPNGEVRWQQWTARIIFNEGGEIVEFQGVGRDCTARKIAESCIKASLQEKEVLLKEIHHRVKNNLQVICSLLSLQSQIVEDPKIVQLFTESKNRILSISLIHEQLYRSADLVSINLTEYIRNLVTQLICSYSPNPHCINLTLEIEPVTVNLETAMPCGLLINELVSNSLKHAFPDNRGGDIRIELHSRDLDRYLLVISDNGRGLPSGLDFTNTDSLGLQLVCDLTRQMKGEISLDKSNGTRFSVQFSQLKYRRRL